MNHIEKKEFENKFESFKNIESNLIWPHLEACSEKVVWLKPEQTAELCHKNDEIIAKHMAKNWIDFFAALNSLKSRL